MQGSFELITQGTVSRLKLGAMSKRKLKMWPNEKLCLYIKKYTYRDVNNPNKNSEKIYPLF